MISATTLLRSSADDFPVSPKIEIPSGIDVADVDVWYFILYDFVDDTDMDSFCASLGYSLCHNVTSGAMGKLVYVSAPFEEVNLLANTFDNLVDAVLPDYNVSLIPDNEDDEHGAHSGFLEYGANPWGLRRIGAKRRVGAGSGVTIFILDTGVLCSHKDFGNRCQSGADFTFGNFEERRYELCCR